MALTEFVCLMMMTILQTDEVESDLMLWPMSVYIHVILEWWIGGGYAAVIRNEELTPVLLSEIKRDIRTNDTEYVENLLIRNIKATNDAEDRKCKVSIKALLRLLLLLLHHHQLAFSHFVKLIPCDLFGG